METKHVTSMRLTPEAKRLLAWLASQYGVTQSAMLELIIREKARQERTASALQAGGQR